MPSLAPAQFLWTHRHMRQTVEGFLGATSRRLVPKELQWSWLALAGAYALCLDNLFGTATNYFAFFRTRNADKCSRRLHRCFEERFPRFEGGDEYDLVDGFAALSRLPEGLYGWIKLSEHNIGSNRVTSSSARMTQPALTAVKGRTQSHDPLSMDSSTSRSHAASR